MAAFKNGGSAIGQSVRGFGLGRKVSFALTAATLTLAAGLLQPPSLAALRPVPSPASAWQLEGGPADLPAHDASIGTAGGEAMAEGGAASYTIPIVVPPGRKGMQPSLSLGYSSRSGTGVAGLGFSLGGLSSLHRCPRTPEQDGESRAVRGDALDRLCLDGQRLIVVNATTLAPIAGQTGYGSDGAVYRTEIDSFVRVSQFGGVLGSASSCFKVESKSGTVRYYGGLPSGGSCNGSARVVPGGTTAPLSWMLRQEADPSGNTVNYSYAASDAGGAYGAGEVLLQAIYYTGHGSDQGDRSVTLLYEPRPAADQTSSFVAGGMTRQTRRLLAIGTHDGTQAARNYTLAYTASAYSGRSLLTSVTECGFAPPDPTQVCHPPTQFSYAHTAATRWPHEFRALTLPGLDAARAQLSPEAAAASAQWPRSESDATVPAGGSNGPSFVRELGDFDGDGTRELGIAVDNGQTQYLASYTADRQLRGLVDASNGLGVEGVLSAGSQLADVNGDGRTDLIGRRYEAGQRRLTAGIWKTTASNSWLPGNFELYNLSTIALPASPSLAGCEEVQFADLNGDGRADLLLTVPASMNCATGAAGRELRVYLGLAGPDPLLPVFSALPSVTRTLDQVTDTNGAVLQERISLMDFDGDGLPDVLVSRSPRIAEQNRVQELWFSRNAGTYSLGGSGQEISSLAAFASPALEADELHKQAYSNWLDVNGDGLADWISIKIQSGQGYWSVRLNQGGLLGPRRVTSSTRGLERCINDTNVNTTNNNCATRWKTVFTSRFRSADVDSDGRGDLLLPRAFAARICVRERTPRIEDPGKYNYNYWCPEDPASGQLDAFPDILFSGDKYYGMYAASTQAPDGSQAGRFADDLDPSAYFLDALRFIQTGDSSFSVEVTATDIIQGQNSFDMYGDGLLDEVAYLGSPFPPLSATQPMSSYPLVGSGAGLGPAFLPDGTAVAYSVSGPSLETDRITFISENLGVGRMGPTTVAPEAGLPTPFALQAGTDLPRLPDLLRFATNGLGEEAEWVIVPLGAGLSVAGLPFYSIPAQRYADARHYYFASSMPVVYSLVRPNGNGDWPGARTQVYSYQEAMYNHQGRGFQGFRAIAAASATFTQAVDRELITRSVYHQKFPLTGRLQELTVAPSSRPSVPVSQETSDWKCWSFGGLRQDCPAPQRDTVYFPYLDRHLAQQFDLVSAESGNTVPLSSVETVNADSEISPASGWDSWGNLTRQVVIRSDQGAPNTRFVEFHRRKTVREFSSNTTSWYLDRLNRETVTSSITYAANHPLPLGVLAPERSVVTDYLWNDDRTPSRQIVQSGVLHEEARTDWCYRSVTSQCPDAPAGINYGLPSSVLSSAPDVTTPRRTRFSYSKNGLNLADDGYFVLVTLNALGEAAITERRPSDGQVTRAYSPANTSVASRYDAFGRVIEVSMRSNLDQLIEPPVATVLRPYESGLQRCASEVGSIGGGGETLAKYCTFTVKEGAPTQISWHDILGRAVKTAERGFDGRWIIRKSEYDIMGQVARQSAPRYASSGSDLWTTREYDRLGRLRRQLEPTTELAPGNGDRLTRVTYAGRLATTRVQDSLLVESLPCPAASACSETSVFDTVLGQPLHSKDTAGGITRSWVDPSGKAVAVLDVGNALTRATFDARGRRLQSIDPDQGTWNFVHNGYSELISETDARGANTTVTTRDALGRVRVLTRTPPTPLPAGMFNEVIVDEWSYNAYSELEQVLRRRGPNAASLSQAWKEQYSYNANTRRLVSVTSTLDGEAAPWTSSITYDANGQIGDRTYPSGLRVRNSYTSWGHLSSLSNADTAAVYWAATAADAWGKVTGETYGTAFTGTHTNAASTGQSRQLRWLRSGLGVEQLDYSYNALGNLKTQQRGGITESYSYDTRQRLTGSSLSGGSSGSVSFEYNDSGNLLRKTDFSANAPNAYGYGGAGCGPHAVSSVTRPGGFVVTYSCDANGNVIGGSALSILFDAENRPRRIGRSAGGSGGGGPADDLIFADGFNLRARPAEETGPVTLATGDMSFAYDAKGARYMEIASSGITRYGPNGYQKLIASSGITHRHELGPVVINRVGSTDTVRYLLRDRLGSTIAVGDTAGTLIERRQFDAFGRARNADFSDRPAGQANLTNTNLGFTGHTQADDAWLVHMNGRLYDQNLGRFLSVDPIVQGGGSQAINPYSYIENNPLSGTDPSGYASNKEECSGTNNGGCTVPLTQAVALTGSHIKGASQGLSSSGGSNLSIIGVNPTPGGQAELQVALAGSSSGYVVQASLIESAASSIAAGLLAQSSQTPQPQSSPSSSTAGQAGGGGRSSGSLQIDNSTPGFTDGVNSALDYLRDAGDEDIRAEISALGLDVTVKPATMYKHYAADDETTLWNIEVEYIKRKSVLSPTGRATIYVDIERGLLKRDNSVMSPAILMYHEFRHAIRGASGQVTSVGVGGAYTPAEETIVRSFEGNMARKIGDGFSDTLFARPGQFTPIPVSCSVCRH